MLGARNRNDHDNHHEQGEGQVQGTEQANSHGNTKNKAFAVAAQVNAAQTNVPVNVQVANGGFAIVATLIDVNIANGIVVKTARGGDASNKASFNNHMNQSNDA